MQTEEAAQAKAKHTGVFSWLAGCVGTRERKGWEGELGCGARKSCKFPSGDRESATVLRSLEQPGEDGSWVGH